MREHKYRAWNEKQGMCDAKEFRKLGLTVTLDGHILFDNFADESLKWKLIQYTGLKDKSGKEIYEFDHLSFTVFDINDNDTQYEGYVVYSGSRFMLWNKPDDEFYGSDGGFDLDWIVNQDDELEVIGNIYENPDLLT